MKKNKNYTWLFALIIIAASHVFCGKKGSDPEPTIIKGKIVNKRNGSPVQNATVTIGFYNNNDGNADAKYTTTDFEGKFEIIDNSDADGISGSDAIKEGFVTHTISHLKLHETNEIDIKFVPIDAVISLQVNNIIGLHDSIYILLKNPEVFQEVGPLIQPTRTKDYPVILKTGEIYNENLKFPGDGFTYLFWGGAPFTLSNAPFQDSIFLSVGDSATFDINF